MEHPSYSILCEECSALRGKTILLGITGSVACYKAIDVARKIMRRGGKVYTIMSKEATKFISPLMFHWATGNKVYTEFTGDVEHISLVDMADALLIAPATANTMSKIAYGIADTTVTLTALSMMGKGKPVVIVPAMHVNLYRSKQITEVIKRLEDLGVEILPPIISKDKAKFPEVDDIALKIEATVLRGSDMKGLNVLVTAGPTREYLDSVRFLTNASSGRMGFSIAREAYFRGARVTLVYGPTLLEPPPWTENFKVETTEEMFNTVKSLLSKRKYDIIVLAGAPSDFKFERVAEEKINSEVGMLTVTLTSTPKILSYISQHYRGGVIVGFAAETVRDNKELIERALNKVRKYNVDLIIANNVSRKDIGFQSKYNEVVIVGSEGCLEEVSKATKEEIARVILDYALKMLK